MRVSLKKLPRRWAGLRFDPSKVRLATFLMLFLKKTAIPVFDAYRAAYAGDFAGLFALQSLWDAMGKLPGVLVWGDFYAKGKCADFDSSVDYETTLADDSSLLASPLSLLLWTTGADWPVLDGDCPGRALIPSDVPTLILSGSLDLSTPAEYARDELLPSLKNGRQIILAEMGHVDDLLGRQRAATEHLLSTFFDSGEADASKFVFDPLTYAPAFRFQTLARILYPLLLLLAA
jgi:hypothetical protein